MKKHNHLVALCFLFIAMLGINPALSQSNTDGAQATRWIVVCNNRSNPEKLQCAMSHTILAAQTRSRVVTVSIQGIENNRTITFALPHGLRVSEGLQLGFDDGATQKFSIQTADANGAYSQVPLTEELLSSMQKGNAIKLILAAANGRGINVEISLAGFSQAYSLMQ